MLVTKCICVCDIPLTAILSFIYMPRVGQVKGRNIDQIYWTAAFFKKMELMTMSHW